MEFTPPEGHERVAEREVRTIKEHVYSSILSLNHAVDEEMVEGIVRDTVTLLNFMPNSETIDVAPRAILDGERLNYARWSRVYAGQVAEFEVPYVNNHKRGVRREIGYVISHQGDNPVVRLLPSGKRLVIRSGHVKVIEKSPAIIDLIEQGISGAKRQRYNDLLAEISEFYAEVGEEQNHIERPDPMVTIPFERDTSTVDLAEQQSEERAPILVDTAPTPPNFQGNAPRSEPSYPIPTSEVMAPADPTPAPLDTLTPTSPVDPIPEPTTRIETEPRRSSRQAAQKPAGYYAKLNKGESVADYTACHMHAAECERLYGKEATLDAGLSEVTNMIGRGAAIPQDFRKLSPRVIQEALPSFLFYKAKEEIVDEQTTATATACQTGTPSNESEIVESVSNEWKLVESKRTRKKKRAARKKTKIKGRWVGGGHRQRRNEALAERVAPTARSATHSIFMAIAAFEGRKLHVGDIPAAYLQADHVPANG